jgi:aryl-alcohol dehydrogenase-like predicted oxidoreductase
VLELRRKKPYLILGALGLGSFLSTEKSFEILTKASQAGLIDIDCAISYGNGKARKIIGEFHKAGGIQFNVWEKIGLEMIGVTSEINKVKTRYPKPENILDDLNKLLDNYQVEKLYSVQLHSPLPDRSRTNILQSLNSEREKGTFEHLGVSNHETFELKKLKMDCELVRIKISSNQVHFSIAEQKAKNDLIAYSCLSGIPVVVNRALARGLLAYANLEDSLRLVVSKKARVQQNKFDSLSHGIKSILLKAADRPISESAISWVLQQEGICAVTLGISSAAQLDSATQAVNYPLEKSQIEFIDFEISRRFRKDVLKLPIKMFDHNY